MKTQYRTGSFQLPGYTIHGGILTIDTGLTFTGTRHLALLLDCSGSMHGSIDRVRRDSVEFVGSLTDDYAVTLIVFSGHRRARRIAGPVLCTKKGVNELASAIEQHVYIMDTTVFSEPLKLALDTLGDLGDGPTAHGIVLFTDGMAVPLQWDPDTEREKALNIADAIEIKHTATVNTLGYGVYYDDNFLRDLSANGVFRHTSSIDAFGSVLSSIREQFDDLVPARLEVELYPDPIGSSNLINLWSASPDLRVMPTGRATLTGLSGGVATFFMMLAKPSDGIRVAGELNGVEFKDSEPAYEMTEEEQTQFIRVVGAGFILTPGAEASAAQLLSYGGDEQMADKAATSYSEREKRETQDRARRYYVNRSFIGAGLKPTGPSHCVLNTMRVLIEDQGNTVFMPPGSYERSGQLAEDPDVIKSPLGSTIKITGYSSAKERFNFSLRGLKKIQVRNHETGGIDDMTQWRTYNIILDGNLHTELLQATLSEDSFDQLQDAGVIVASDIYSPDQTYELDFSSLRLISPVFANPRNLGLVPLMQEEKDLMAEQTALNARIKKLGKSAKDRDDNVRHPTGTVREAVEFYDAPCTEYRLLKYKAEKPDEAKISKLSFKKADERVSWVRNRLIVVRWIIRSIVFAMETVDSTVIKWGPEKTTQRGHEPKIEQEADLDGARLRRVRWTESIGLS